MLFAALCISPLEATPNKKALSFSKGVGLSAITALNLTGVFFTALLSKDCIPTKKERILKLDTFLALSGASMIGTLLWVSYKTSKHAYGNFKEALTCKTKKGSEEALQKNESSP